jgi:hypothetical protein
MLRLLIIMLFPLGALAHPGIGIVQNSKGAVYYTDLKQVWKIDPNGRRQVAVPLVHTHELYIDSSDNLYGEHLWYNGERENTWGHFVWRLSAEGVLDTIAGPNSGFLENYSFVRDGAGNMYWVEEHTVSRFMIRAPDGSITTLAEGRFKGVRWLHATPQGVLYFMDAKDLYKVSPDGKVRLVAKDITQHGAAFAGAGRSHALFGIWTDKTGNIYVANYSGRVVKSINPNGKIQNAVFSEAPWAPTGGLFDKHGDLWLLEVSNTNEVQVRRVSAATIGADKKSNTLLHLDTIPWLAVLVAVGLLFFMIWFLSRKPRHQAT